MKINFLILLTIFAITLVSCEKDMKWINPDDSKADQSEIGKICAERSAECGMIEYEYLGKTRKVFCGKCEEGYDCNSNNKCEKIGGDNDPVSDDTDTKPDEDSDSTPDDDADTDSGYSDTTPDKDSDTTPDDDTDTGSFEDTDMIPDKDTDMTSDNEPDEDENSVDEDIDTDTIPADPCDPNPCTGISNSTGVCTATGTENYSCGCNDGYYWWGIEKGCIDTPLTLGKICTGQTSCYNASSSMICPTSSSADFYGQDAQYTSKCVAQSFTLGTGAQTGTVIDNNTGLIWEQSPSEGTYTWDDAPNHCADLNSSNFGGKSNWRVPNPLEFMTIVDKSKLYPSPATNSNFTNMPTDYSTYLWTSKEYKGDTIDAYYFSPLYGSYSQNRKTKTYQVLCVSGDEMQPATSADFTTQTISEADVVTDSKTGLMWQKEYVTGKTWQEALKYCEDSTYAGYSDWRLPNGNELASLVNYEKSGQPYSYFPDMTNTSYWFWSSSKSNSAYSADGAVVVDFSAGRVNGGYKTDKWYVRCVRNVSPECSTSNTGPCYDSTSHLTWSKKADTTYTWSDAGTYCDNLTEGGYSDWRLPNISELRTLIKNCSGTQMPGGSCGVIDTGNSSTSCLSSSCWTESDCYSCSYDSTGGHSKFGETGWFWSSSTQSDNTDGAWSVNFYDGYVDGSLKTYNGHYVRCVR